MIQYGLEIFKKYISFAKQYAFKICNLLNLQSVKILYNIDNYKK